MLLLVAAIAQICAIFGIALYARHAIRSEKQDLAEQLRAFVQAPAEGKMSPMAEMVELVSARLAAHLVAQVREFIRVQGSASKRQELAIQGELMQSEVSERNPLIGMLLSQFPGIGKRLLKNPSALPALLNLVGGLGGGGNHGGTNTGDDIEARIRGQAV